MSEVVPYINYQQERYNGGGYPEGLKGNSIPLGSSKFIVSFDTYDQTKYGRRSFNSDTEIYLTAPYLVAPKNVDKTNHSCHCCCKICYCCH